jgi:hypothetical protein
MPDLVGTCPKDFWPDWIAEGDAAGEAYSGEEWGWYTQHSLAAEHKEFLDKALETICNRLQPAVEAVHCYQEVFSNQFGTTKAIVCSCGFATTYTVLSNDADERGREHFNMRHAAIRAADAEKAGAK